jgi:TetR/AcrR family transcriptional regulator
MRDKLEKMEQERKEKLVNAALKEFAVKGYDEASTNIIAKEAGLSKSLLFHYVGSKRELFLLLYEIAIKTIMDDFFGSIDLQQKDMIERCQQIAFVKMEVLHKYPQLFDFFKTAIDATSEEVKPDLEKRNKGLRSIGFENLFDGVDKSLFRDDIEPDRAVKMVTWFMNGFADEIQAKVSNLRMDEINFEALTENSNAFFALLKKILYKGES